MRNLKDCSGFASQTAVGSLVDLRHQRLTGTAASPNMKTAEACRILYLLTSEINLHDTSKADPHLQAVDEADEAEEVEVCQADFWQALRGLEPSLSPAELQRYQALRRQFETGQ